MTCKQVMQIKLCPVSTVTGNEGLICSHLLSTLELAAMCIRPEESSSSGVHL